jgi:hypothetical protein
VVVALLVPAVGLLFRFAILERIGTIVLSVLVPTGGVASDGGSMGRAGTFRCRSQTRWPSRLPYACCSSRW